MSITPALAGSLDRRARGKERGLLTTPLLHTHCCFFIISRPVHYEESPRGSGYNTRLARIFCFHLPDVRGLGENRSRDSNNTHVSFWYHSSFPPIVSSRPPKMLHYPPHFQCRPCTFGQKAEGAKTQRGQGDRGEYDSIKVYRAGAAIIGTRVNCTQQCSLIRTSAIS